MGEEDAEGIGNYFPNDTFGPRLDAYCPIEGNQLTWKIVRDMPGYICEDCHTTYPGRYQDRDKEPSCHLTPDELRNVAERRLRGLAGMPHKETHPKAAESLRDLEIMQARERLKRRGSPHSLEDGIAETERVLRMARDRGLNIHGYKFASR